jgi:hypothetical protein
MADAPYSFKVPEEANEPEPHDAEGRCLECGEVTRNRPAQSHAPTCSRLAAFYRMQANDYQAMVESGRVYESFTPAVPERRPFEHIFTSYNANGRDMLNALIPERYKR